jgi:tripartite-type tricarboxylate transporter receptor subunit TctC
MVPDIASGLINSTFLSANQALARVQTGAIRIIATINGSRTKYFPDVPTMAEQGYPDAQVAPWFGIVVPAGTPQPITDRISKALEVALATADVRQKLDIAGCETISAPLSRFGDIIKADVALWARVVKEAGITAD